MNVFDCQITSTQSAMNWSFVISFERVTEYKILSHVDREWRRRGLTKPLPTRSYAAKAVQSRKFRGVPHAISTTDRAASQMHSQYRILFALGVGYTDTIWGENKAYRSQGLQHVHCDALPVEGQR